MGVNKWVNKHRLCWHLSPLLGNPRRAFVSAVTCCWRACSAFQASSSKPGLYSWTATEYQQEERAGG